MKISVVLTAVVVFAAASLVQAETPALRRAEAAPTKVAETKGNAEGRCDQWNNWCNHMPPPRIADNATPQAVSAEGEKDATETLHPEPPTNVAETKGNAEGRCDQFNNWCNHMPPPRIADNATPQAVGAETKVTVNGDDGGRPCHGGPSCNQDPPSQVHIAAWLEKFKRVLASTTAERDLADMDDDSESQSENARARRFVKMKKGTAIKSDPYAGAKLLCKVEDEAEEFEVIAQVDKFLAIVLTGHGVGWAPGVSVASERTVTTLLTGETKMNRNIKTLMWDSGAHPCHTRASGWGERAFNAHLETLISFLEVVGEPLERLHVPQAQLTTEHLARILAACPNLKELNVSGHEMESIAPLRDAYATGNCHISTLSIARTDARYLRGTTNPELIEILRGPGGQTLSHLAVHLLPSLRGTG